MRLINSILLAFFIFAVSTNSYAIQCWANKKNGPVSDLTTLPETIDVPASTGSGAVIWESPSFTKHIYCESSINEPVAFWVNPRRRPVGEGLEVALRYKGNVYRESDGAVPTGFSVDRPFWLHWDREFDVTYSLLLLRKGDSPVSGPVPISQYSVLQLDSQSGVNASGAQLFNHLISGTVTFAPGTCDIQAGDDRKTVSLPPVQATKLSGVGATAGRTGLTVSVQNCIGVRQVKFSFSGDPDSAMPVAFRNTGTATGVAVRLANAADNATLAPGGTGNSVVEPVTSGAATVNLQAEYIGTTGRPGGGSVASLATMHIEYQ
ncbi:fimbrial protein [Burkholderia ambifaria]|uniref:fimbrial protein n=1 Tax=Burkholderia ambifaria TaxID=152480 RepID=UPI0013E04375|nr:fimbrial protein [Burkholderia ambifaria]UEP25805.1 type 1 fimbrial protein [Burkholderia ambifaria]WAS58536.1 type 1 fimbrial protein [Burkholderia ambifaria]WDR97728.1 fimbrial protein [Burkholderia ambifaria]